MNNAIEPEEIYYEEMQNTDSFDPLQANYETKKTKNRFGSCVLRREGVSTAPIKFNRRGRQPAHKEEDNMMSSLIIKKQQKKTQQSNSPSPPSSPVPFKNNSKHTQLSSFRTILSSKNQTPPNNKKQNSIYKIQRSSQSPNRRNLYWQSWLLEGKDKLTPHTSLIPQTLKYEQEPLPVLTAAAHIAMVSNTREVLMQQNSCDQREIASLTKIMTAYTVVCICNTHGIKINEAKVTIPQQACFMEGTSANLKAGEQLLIIDLLYGLLLPSGNDAGVALAQFFGKFLSFKFAVDNESNDESLSSMQRFLEFKEFYDKQYQRQSIKLFVFEMNKNCQKIGLKNTHFANPTGLANSKNVSTAQDVATLTAHCMNNLLLRQIFKKKVYSCQVANLKLAYYKQIQWRNTNKHLYQFRECIGAKTGITLTAGPCLSSVYRILHRQIIVVVLGCASIDDRYEDARKIYTWCRRNMRVR